MPFGYVEDRGRGRSEELVRQVSMAPREPIAEALGPDGHLQGHVVGFQPVVGEGLIRMLHDASWGTGCQRAAALTRTRVADR